MCIVRKKSFLLNYDLVFVFVHFPRTHRLHLVHITKFSFAFLSHIPHSSILLFVISPAISFSSLLSNRNQMSNSCFQKHPCIIFSFSQFFSHLLSFYSLKPVYLHIEFYSAIPFLHFLVMSIANAKNGNNWSKFLWT